MSFSAHSDNQGLLTFFQQVRPSNLVLVHGDGAKMLSFKNVVEDAVGCHVFCPKDFEILHFTFEKQ